MLVLDALFCSFVAVVCIQVIYYLFIFGNFAFLNHKNLEQTKSIPVSVIICAKNEAENIKRYLPSILNQNYPNFEVVLINDCSTDDTLKIMNNFAADHANIKIIDIKGRGDAYGNKKQALTEGIKASTYDYLLFTDADCEAISSDWISQMAGKFNKSKLIVLGYGGYFKIKNSFINTLIRYETLLTAIQYFSYAKIGLPYMGVGRNLAYHKNEFIKTNGFNNHINMPSGDDDLFINETANSRNTAICFSSKSVTRSEPKKNLGSWITQKRRHVSTAKHYKRKHKLLLGLFYCSQFLFWGLAIALLIIQYPWKCILPLVALRSMVVYITLTASARKLDETNLVLLNPILELFLILIQFGIFITNLISKPKHWK